MEKKYTIKDIAKLANVSKGTVDRVLHKRGKVSPKALEEINGVLKTINYEPNLIARNLKNNKIYRICILLPDPNLDPYWLPCLKGIADALNEFKAYGLEVLPVFFDPENKKTFLKSNQTLLELAPDAVLLAPVFHKETIEAIEKYNTSNIIVNTFNNQVESDFVKSFVGQDLFRSGRVAAKLLDTITPNCQIAVIHIDENYKNAIHMQEKEKGFRDYFKLNSHYIITTLKLKGQNIETNLRLFLKENPDLAGIYVTTSKAYQVAKIIKEENANTIKIVGYDLIHENINYLKAGVINFIIHQNQKRQVYLGITTLIEHFIFQKEIEKEILLPIDIINLENYDYYIE